MTEEVKYCPYCGSNVNPTDVFCNNCGASLEPTTSEPTYSPPEEKISPYVSHDQPRTVTGPRPTTNQNTTAIASLALGIISVVFIIIPGSSFYLQIAGGVLAMILGGIALKTVYRRNFAITGIVLGLIGSVFWILEYLNIFDIWYYI